jgi:DNA mismatch repair protein MutL
LTSESGVVQLVADRLDHLLATMACHSVVRAGDVLSEREVRALLESMDGIDYRAHCPHGRPVLLRLSIGEIERRFGRT